MGGTAMHQHGPQLRLVFENADPRVILMPILDLERRLAAVERELRRPAMVQGRREALTEIRALLRCELEARPFNPSLARRCEHRLRWVERTLGNGTGPTRPISILGRARAVLNAILPPPLASA